MPFPVDAPTAVLRPFRIERFGKVDVWLFDLDNTLYPPSCDLFAQIERRMTEFVMAALGLEYDRARAVQKRYFREHGTTLRGMMNNHGTNPQAYLGYVHDVDLSAIPEQPGLAAALAALPGRKLIYTNATKAHANRVLARIGVDAALFEAVFDIIDADYRPKPAAEPLRDMLARYAVVPERAALVDDLPWNLATAAAHGLATVHVAAPDGAASASAVATGTALAGPLAPGSADHVTDDLAGFLAAVTRARA